MRTPLLVVPAGASSRLWPLEEKSLIKFMGRPLLSLQLERYAQLGMEQAVIVANPENRAVIEALVMTVSNMDVQVVQAEPKGMGDALLQIEPVLEAQGNQPITSPRSTT